MEKCVPGWCFSCLDLLQGSLGEIPYQPAECFRISWCHINVVCLLEWEGKKIYIYMARIGNWKIVGYLWLGEEKGRIWMHRDSLCLSALCADRQAPHTVSDLNVLTSLWLRNEQQVPCRESGQNLSTLTKKEYCGSGSSRALHDFTANHASSGRRTVFIFCIPHMQSCITCRGKGHFQHCRDEGRQ